MGCFWQPDKLFSDVLGVLKTTVGYTGGHVDNPTYKQVCSGKTGHAEATEIEYDPDKINFNELLDIFWKNHNPTTANRQGPDVGEQYRSAIFYHNDDQKKLAEKTKAELDQSGKFKNPIVTEITKAQTFYPAEEYHQKYLIKNGLDSCRI